MSAGRCFFVGDLVEWNLPEISEPEDLFHEFIASVLKEFPLDYGQGPFRVLEIKCINHKNCGSPHILVLRDLRGNHVPDMNASLFKSVSPSFL